MKKQFLFLAFSMLSLTSICQTKDVKKDEPKDTTQAIMLTDTTNIACAKDIRTFAQMLERMPHNEYITKDPVVVMQDFLNWILQKYQKPAVKPKAKK